MIIDGKKIAEEILLRVKTETASLPNRPVFCDVLVGEDAVSRSYVNIKGRKAAEVGMDFLPVFLPAGTSQKELEEKITELNSTPNLCGLIIQLPLPPGLQEKPVLNAVLPENDVDCMGAENQSLFYAGKPRFLLPTAAAIMEIFKILNIEKNKAVVVIGQGELVGRPVAFLLRQQGHQVSTADRKVLDLKALCLSADVIISAVGSPNLVRGDMVKPGAVVIDAGTSESGGGIVGDVETESVGKVAGFLTPVPGGVGPVTVAMLLSNVLLSAKQKNQNRNGKNYN